MSSSSLATLPLSIQDGKLGPDIPGMTGGVHIGVPFVETTLTEIERLNAKNVFVLCNNSSRKFVEPTLIKELEKRNILAGPLCSDIGMGGEEHGLLKAANKAAAAACDDDVDCVVTIGGGAIHDGGKLIRLWLAGKSNVQNSDYSKAQTGKIRTIATNLDDLLLKRELLVPQICCPNSFAMAELTCVAGMTLTNGVKSGASHHKMMPTTTIFDPALTEGLPDWVRYGTALRCVEHAVGAITHPNSDENQKMIALNGLTNVIKGIETMIQEPTSREAMIQLYTGGWSTIRALNTNGCYPALGHMIENMYSAKYNVHQGSCSGILCARILSYHVNDSANDQLRIVKVFDDYNNSNNNNDATATTNKSASKLITDLVARLPGVAKDHSDANVDVATLRKIDEWDDSTWHQLSERFNRISPTPFDHKDDVHSMVIKPLDQL